MDAVIPSVLQLWIFAYSYRLTGPEQLVEDPFETHSYACFPEVERACSSALSGASKLEINVNKMNSRKLELTFVKGDWEPFDKSDALPSASGIPDPLRLATFMLTHVDLDHHSRNAVNVTGDLGISLSRNGTAPETNRSLFPEFRIWPGSSKLSILFEGVYTESEANGGEQVMCLLGASKLPSRLPDSTDPWQWVKNSRLSNFQPTLLEDDRILLVLRYPKTFSLTSRAVRGEMRSMNEKSSL